MAAAPTARRKVLDLLADTAKYVPKVYGRAKVAGDMQPESRPASQRSALMAVRSVHVSRIEDSRHEQLIDILTLDLQRMLFRTFAPEAHSFVQLYSPSVPRMNG